MRTYVLGMDWELDVCHQKLLRVFLHATRRLWMDVGEEMHDPALNLQLTIPPFD